MESIQARPDRYENAFCLSTTLDLDYARVMMARRYGGRYVRLSSLLYIYIYVCIHISRVFLDKLMHAEGNWIA